MLKAENNIDRQIAVQNNMILHDNTILIVYRDHDANRKYFINIFYTVQYCLKIIISKKKKNLPRFIIIHSVIEILFIFNWSIVFLQFFICCV